MSKQNVGSMVLFLLQSIRYDPTESRVPGVGRRVQGVGLGMLGTKFGLLPRCSLLRADAVGSGDSHGLEVPWRGGTACGRRPLVPLLPPPYTLLSKVRVLAWPRGRSALTTRGDLMTVSRILPPCLAFGVVGLCVGLSFDAACRARSSWFLAFTSCKV